MSTGIAEVSAKYLVGTVEGSVPVGYKQTDVGIIPEDWDVLSLAQLIAVLDSGVSVNSIDIIEAYTHGKHVLKTSCVTNGKFNPFEAKSILPRDIVRAKCTVQKEAIIVSRMNTPALVGELGFVPQDEANLFLPDRLWQAILKKEKNTCSKWLTYLLSYPLNSRRIKESATGTSGSMKNISKESFLSLNIPVPQPSEQTAIANALSDVDALIQELEKLIAKKQAIKTATMQQLLTGRTRLPAFGFEKSAHHPDGRKKGYKPSELGEIPEDWEVYPLGNLVKSTQLGGNYKNTEQDSVHPLIKMGNLGRGHIKLDKLEFIVGIAKQIDRLNYGDLLFNTRNTLELVGKVSVWRNELPEAYFNSNLMRICFKNELVGSNFYMNAVMNSESFVNDLSDIATGTTSVAAIYSRDLLQLRIALPQPDEQICIAEVLINMDDEIQLLEQRLNKTRQIKQGMMQELLTGKTRLVKPAEPA